MKPQSLLICLGSNDGQEYHIQLAKQKLLESIPGLLFSKVLWTLPIGHVTPLYLNVLAFARTTISYEGIYALTKHIEQEMGRDRTNHSNQRVCIDIDILKYGENI